MQSFEDFQKDVEELKYYYEYLQQVRTLLFWAVEPHENRDKLAMTILARYTLDWMKSRPERLHEDAEQLLTELCNKILESGAGSGTPIVLEPMRIGMTFRG